MPATLLTILEVIAALALILTRQLAPRRIRDNLLRLPLILGVIGVVEATKFLGGHRVTPGETAGLAAALVVAAAVAWPRAHSMRVWRADDGTWMRQGNLATVAWWAVALAGHLATTFAGPLVFGERPHGLGGFDSATLLVYLGVSLGAQGFFLEQRLQRGAADRQAKTVVR